MNLISLDLELNMPSGKIIEVGYVIFNVKTKKVLLEKSILVEPMEVITEEITQLTGITNEMVRGQKSIYQAFEELLADKEKYQASKYVVQWGSGDIHQLIKQGHVKTDNPFNTSSYFGTRYYDVKSLCDIYQMAIPQGKTKGGLQIAMKRLGIEPQRLPAHRALPDAYNTMLVFNYLVDKFKLSFEVEQAVDRVRS